MASTPFKKPFSSMNVATITRETNTGRVIRYDLTVIQQPERARACGSGAKSSADRRPVDPPPVVELRIFEKILEKWEDITFAYGANFFLFATLESSRPMARGRGQQPATSQIPPVLTGMPVSGMAYLDRPQEAGYFIFPDLSVRHEGQYILSFNLYEETRPEAEMSVKQDKGMAAVMSPDASFDWRLEIKSETFTVYSAKKFPGLAESTSLSRTVAEQGCRVRIRRDVRMRRREGKNNGDEAQEEEYRASRPIEQDTAQARSRSNSGSPDGHPEHQNGLRSERSLSPRDSQNNKPIPPGGHLGNLGYGSDRAAPPVHFATPSFPGQPQGQHYAAHQPQFQNQGPQFPQYGHPQLQPATGHQGYGERIYPNSAVEQHERPMYENPDPRRASFAGFQPTYPSQHGQPPVVDHNYNRQYQPIPSTMPSLPPLRMEKRESITSSGPLTPFNVAPLRSPTNDRHERPAPYPYFGQQLAPAPAPLTPSQPAEPMRLGMKRSHDSVFNSSDSTRPLHNGMRPGSSHCEKPVVDDEDEEVEIPDMYYKRADGSGQQRCLPTIK